MAIRVKLLVDDEIFNVLNYSIRLNQGADNTGKPTQRTVFKRLILTVESSKDADFHIWMLEKNLTKNIELHLEPDIIGTRIRKIKLYDAHLIALNTNFSSTSEEPLSETLTITAAGLEDSFSAGVYSSSWRVTYPQEETTATTIEEEKEFTRNYLTNSAGDEISEYNIGDTIFVCLETKNRIGDKITINLNDPDFDFEHNGVHLKNDILKNYIISEDLEKVELKVIQQKNS